MHHALRGELSYKAGTSGVVRFLYGRSLEELSYTNASLRSSRKLK